MRDRNGKWIAYWVITQDHISDGEANGVYNGDPAIALDNPKSMSKFEMYDDDGVLYYNGEIYGEYDGFEPLDNYGMPNAGCTGIKIDGEWL